jgi:hypothetical protein
MTFQATSRTDRTTATGARRWLALAQVVCAAAVALGAYQFAPPIAASSPGESAPEASSEPTRSRITLEVLGTLWDRPTGAPKGDVRVVLEPGQRATHHIVAGNEDAELYHVGFVKDPAGLRPSYLWEVQIQLLAVSPTETTVELRWSRSRPREQEAPVAGDVRTVTLRPGEYHLFDYVAADTRSTSCANVVLRILADPLPEPPLQPPVSVDLWVAQEDARGRHWARQQVAGRPGHSLPFTLGPLEWSLDGTPTSHGSDDAPIRLDVSGTVQPVLRADGRLDVAVEMTRGFSLGRARVTGKGRATFDCAFDEAVEIQLPDARGQSRALVAGRAGTPVAPGVQESGQLTVVDFAQFFAAKPTSLYIVVHHAR